MKELHHICFTSHDEVMFRDEEDHGMFVNLMALRCFSSNTEIVVDAEMSTHVHQAVFSARPLEFARRERMSYTKYFNYKYGRYGRLGQKYTFLQPVKGFMHQMTLSSYILRNGLHHSAVSAAFGYPYCTIRDLFSDNLGFGRTAKANYSRQEMASYLPRHAEFPDEFEMDSSGVFLRRSFMEIRQAEQYYVTPRNYLYQMNRLTDENWFREQLKDETGAPLTLADIEHADEQYMAVLAAEIISKYAYLQYFASMSKSLKMKLIRGNSAAVDQVAADICAKYGEKILRKVAKLNFTNTKRVNAMMKGK